MENNFKITEKENAFEMDSINFWIRDIRNSESLNSIVESKAFQRLFDISFLGAIDYSEDTKLLKIERNRAVHSLYVAGIANYVATARKYDDELKEHVVAAALLHDIGHMPLSHSAEPYIKKHLGIGHHDIGDKIISGEIWNESKLNYKLSKKYDISFIQDMLNGNYHGEGSDIFNSKINADTIDGIIRCLEYKGINKTNYLNRISIAKAAFIEGCEMSIEKRIDTLDEFWKSKHFVYHNFINTKHGVLSDTVSQIFFCEVENISITDLIDKEKCWKKKYKNLFSWLENLKTKKIPDCLKNYELQFTTRKYEVNKSELEIKKRYVNTKEKITLGIESFDSYKEEQLKLEI